jgi:ATP-binding cassette subfamily F protein 3
MLQGRDSLRRHREPIQPLQHLLDIPQRVVSDVRPEAEPHAHSAFGRLVDLKTADLRKARQNPVRPANFLILDEPTSHLDIASREVLERALREYAGTLLIVSHDIEFVRKTATTIFFLDEKGLTRYYGDYDYFRAKRAAEQSGSAAAESAKRADGAEPAKAELRKEQKREEAQRRNELYKKRKPLEDEVARCEKLIAKLEAEQTDITEKLYCSTEALDFPALNRRLADIQAELAASTASWEKSAMELEALLSEAG